VLTLNGRGDNIGSSPSKMTDRTVSFVDDKPPLSKRIEVRKASLNTVPDTAKRIEDLCSELGKATATRSNLCIGILVDASNKRWHRIWPPPPSLFEELRTQPSQALAGNTQDSSSYIPTMDHADYATAQQRIGELITYAGDNYGLAVSRCIYGLNRPGEPPRASQSTLDNEVFKNDVYINIVCLLEKNLEVHLPRVRT
jgi:hypothetical protein